MGHPGHEESTQHPLPRTRQTIVHLLERHRRFQSVQKPPRLDSASLHLSLSSLSTTQTLPPPHLPTPAHCTYAGDDYSPPCLTALPPVFFFLYPLETDPTDSSRNTRLLLKPFSLPDYSAWNQLILSLPGKKPAGGILVENSILGSFQENMQLRNQF